MSSPTDRPTGRPRTIDPDAVSLVALRLFNEQGFDTVSMDDVAIAAEVSRRSLFRLFPSKAALVWAGIDEFATRFTAALDARPASETSDAALRAAYRIAATFPDAAVEVTRRRFRVIAANPTLEHIGDPTIARLASRIVEFVADRDGAQITSLGVAVRARILASAASAALAWWAQHGTGRPEDAVDAALKLVPDLR
ncbi:TetR/AcrR family transcriptional regulator [Curtobacterium sp. ME26]|uniref:TetR/AcrR family transcriptional regulator n=1 Tax=Curtobacterium sp. ME26 TaxID=2744254 RepID=UPI0015F4C029|nr:TetR/AcrR family transcriptional regulator [Curtobacterium sp. ME26]